LAKLFQRTKQAITSKYPRSKLAADGTNFAISRPHPLGRRHLRRILRP
jgi:phage tail sheath gpL-like